MAVVIVGWVCAECRKTSDARLNEDGLPSCRQCGAVDQAYHSPWPIFVLAGGVFVVATLWWWAVT